MVVKGKGGGKPRYNMVFPITVYSFSPFFIRLNKLTLQHRKEMILFQETRNGRNKKRKKQETEETRNIRNKKQKKQETKEISDNIS